MRYSKDIEFIEIFPSDCGIDLTYSVDGQDYKTIYEGEFPRKVTLDITSWRGMTAGAVHFYGELVISSLKSMNLDTGKVSYLQSAAPESAKGLKIQLTRAITKRDLIMDRGQRFKGAKLGERVKNFDTKDQVKAAAISFFKQHFTDGWTLVLQSPVSNMSVMGETVENEESVLFC